jgi:hypothetical protein
MEILVKEFKGENHVYMFDTNMRPLSVEVLSKRKTRGYIKKLIKKYNIIDLKVTNVIDFSNDPNYIIDRI